MNQMQSDGVQLCSIFFENSFRRRAIANLDLSKPFDRAKWESFWQAAGARGESEHVVWVLGPSYY